MCWWPIGRGCCRRASTVACGAAGTPRVCCCGGWGLAAGLHFTADLLKRLAERSVGFTTLVLHVGLDTFRPLTESDPALHQMHREWYTLPAETQRRIEQTRAAGRRVVAVGTTSVRA